MASGIQNARYMQESNQAVAVEAIPVLEAHVDRLRKHAQDIDVAAQRLHTLADRTLGMRPAESGKAGAPTPEPSHSLGKMEDAHEWIGRARENLADAVQRLERL
jgi:hypothetical protein